MKKEYDLSTMKRRQSLINLYLRDCVANGRKADLTWHSNNAA